MQNLQFEDIADKWVYIDTSKMLFSKLDLKEGGYCTISVGFGEEIAKFSIAEISFDRGYIRLKLLEAEDSLSEEFIGFYDPSADSLDLKLGSIDNHFIFIKESKFKKKLLDLGNFRDVVDK